MLHILAPMAGMSPSGEGRGLSVSSIACSPCALVLLCEDTLDGHNQAVTRGGNGLEERFGRCWHGAVQHDLDVLTQDTDVHGAGMQVDTAVQWVLRGVESP